VAEVEQLLASGISRDVKPMQSLGYRHMCAHVLDGLPLDEAVRRTLRDTRRFARKQRTWSRSLGFPTIPTGHLAAAEAAAYRAFGSPDDQ
jgi:tRNA A37 N6-isopentenylltransferase MiaA